jgi:hypothetical protein
MQAWLKVAACQHSHLHQPVGMSLPEPPVHTPADRPGSCSLSFQGPQPVFTLDEYLLVARTLREAMTLNPQVSRGNSMMCRSGVLGSLAPGRTVDMNAASCMHMPSMYMRTWCRSLTSCTPSRETLDGTGSGTW